MSIACAEQMSSPEKSGLADAVLREILALLDVFAATGETACIDLGGLPLSRDDRSDLDDCLGRGEIVATLNIVGRSEIWETAFSGVWRVRHFGADQIAVDLVEISSCAEILRTDRRDARLAVARLTQALEQRNAANAEMSDEK